MGPRWWRPTPRRSVAFLFTCPTRTRSWCSTRTSSSLPVVWLVIRQSVLRSDSYDFVLGSVH